MFQQFRQGGRAQRARPDPGRLRHCPADFGSASDRTWRAHRRGRDIGSAAAGQRADPPAFFHRRVVRPPRPGAVPDRPEPISGRRQPGLRQCQQRPGRRGRRAGARQPLPAAGRDRGDLQAGLYRRRGPGPPSAGWRRPDRRRARGGPDQPSLHLDPGTDQRAHRAVAVHGRGAGHRQSDRTAGRDPAGRPDVRRHPAVERRPCDIEARPCNRRRCAAAAPRSGSSSKTAAIMATPEPSSFPK